MKEEKWICTYEQPEPINRGNLQKIKICHWAFQTPGSKPIRAYKIVWDYDLFSAQQRNLVDPELIFDIGYV